MMYQMVCLDLDGTLLNRSRAVSMENRKALIDCLDRGIYIYLVTGRPPCFARWLARQIDPRIRVICSNGAWYQLGSKVVQHPLSSQAVQFLLDILQNSPTTTMFFKNEHHIYTNADHDDRFLYDHLNADLPLEERCHSHTGLSPAQLSDHLDQVVKVLVYEENRPRLQQIYDQIQAYPTLEPTGCAPVGFDVVATGVDKAHAISLVCDDLHLSMEQFICMGDGDNDIQMLQQAGLGVAMGNADDLVKASADVCAPSNDEDGVAWVLRNYCLTTPNT